MAVGLPILEQIAQNIVTTLEAIAPPNYSTTPTIVRWSVKGNSPRDALMELYQESPTRDDANSARPYITWRQPFTVICCAIEQEGSATSIDQRLNYLRADAEKALMQDRTRGGLAIDTTLEAPELAAPPAALVAVKFTVLYRTLETDPYT